jgi:LL-diaminopimelate aminotransferase
MRPSSRLEKIPPYAFAQLERKIAEKRAAGVDVISLGIGDPDRPTPPLIVEAMQEAVTEAETHQYPSNRGRADFRGAVRDFYERRFDVSLDPESEIIPALGGKEAIFNLNLAFLDPGDYALAADPGYPVYTGGPWLAGAEPVLMALQPDRGFVPDLAAIDEDVASRAKLMYLNYPNNPTGAIVPEGFFEQVVDFARANEILVVHDMAYSEIVFDGYKAPSFLATPGAKDIGVEVYSLSKGFNMTGWRAGAVVGNADAIETYWRLKTNIDSGMFEALQLAAIAALSPEVEPELASMVELYRRRRDLVCDALAEIGVEVRRPHATIYVWAPVPADFDDSAAYAEHVLEQAGVVVTPGAVYGPAGEGWFRISLTTRDELLLEAVQRLGRLGSG